jgi:hypothetical protein
MAVRLRRGGTVTDGLNRLLDAWRDAERNLAQQQPGTSEHAAASARLEACRDAYRAMADEALRRSTGAEMLADDSW